MIEMKAALFDLDGTLLDSEGRYTEIWTKIGQKYRPDIPDLAYVIKGTTLPQIMSYFAPEDREAVYKELWEGENALQHEFFPGAMEYVRLLQKLGVKTAIVTSSDMKKINHVLDCCPEIREFDMMLTSEDFTKGKPDPECYLLAAERLGFRADECVVFEDAFSGIEAGKRAGMRVVAMAHTLTAEQLEGKCDRVVTGSWHELIAEVHSASTLRPQ
ncbi:MAG: HAD family phosphatase [Bacteroidales bacterium]|nr:HAD family phosphatase [Candidatus Colicola faecequi]